MTIEDDAKFEAEHRKRHHKHHFGWRPDLPDIRDYQYSTRRYHLEKPRTLPRKVDLRPGDPPVYDQGDLGSCTANGVAAVFEFDRIKQKEVDFTPSRLFIYFNERKIEGTVPFDAGAAIRNGIKSVATDGVCKETDWPYVESKFADTPPVSTYDLARKYRALNYFRLDNTKLYELKSCLAAGFPFVFGFTVYQSFMDASDNGGIIPMPSADEQALDGHAVVCVGYDDDAERFTIRNSWGTDSGDKGYLYMPYKYLTDDNLADDFWTIRTVTHDEGLVVPPPFELRRASRREQTPHNAAVAGFAVAINEAEKHRQTLKRRFGYTDQQIGNMALTYKARKRTP
jgi:C1A family cysteine protease